MKIKYLGKLISVLLVLLILTPLQSYHPTYSEERWKQFASFKSGINFFQIGCYRSHGDKTCFEDILPRQDQCLLVIWRRNHLWLRKYTDYETKPDTTHVISELITPLPKYTCKGDDKNKVITETFELTPEDGILGIRIKKVERLFPLDKSIL